MNLFQAGGRGINLPLWVVITLFGLMLMTGCDVLGSPAPTPVIITATSPAQRFVIVTNTPTASPSPVLAPTLPGQEVSVSLLGGDGTPTPYLSPTPLNTLTPTFTVTPTDTPQTPGALIQPVGGLAQAGTLTACPSGPTGGFGALYNASPDLAAQLGCPIGETMSISNAQQGYERGLMLWMSSLGPAGGESIYALFSNGSYQRFNDTWLEGVDPISLGLTPPNGLIEPIRGFGKVWRDSAGVSEAIGWATTGENGGSATLQAFERGEMIYVPQTGQTYILVAGQPGTWTSSTQVP